MTARRSQAESPDFLTPVIYHTLLVLAESPRHGYAISQEVAELTAGAVTMGPGTLYGTLQRLSDNAWVERTSDVDPEGPHADRRRYYRLTAAGREVLQEEAHRLAQAAQLARERAIIRDS